MRAELRAHFRAEILEARLLIVVGLLALGAALFLWQTASGYASAAIPLALFGLLEVGLGAQAWRARRRLASELAVALARDPAAFQQAELARLGRAPPLFGLQLTLDAGMVLVGAAIVALALADPLGAGFGLALLAQGLLSLAIEAAAHRRLLRYQKTVEAILTDAGARDAQAELAE
jgi:hypothetical protein